ncbi:hypothetical protein [Bifidobacterium biavatii]|uniref:Uncharacterized protein n=1 Tax=Bifidobacterium biavatii DSM 23969 TaxID=1437608 RepID=A0A086ZLW9_9BIFI|nr:hypothetical protein [Bifidobacterium biavatii]KFI47519.1 hypothetical protein BBIA_1147 [Bifidobacterium biavatii DSM 23969]
MNAPTKCAARPAHGTHDKRTERSAHSSARAPGNLSAALPLSMLPHDKPPTAKPLLGGKDLPGPLSLTALSDYGMMTRLDETNGYQMDHAGTLFGRASIAARIAPRNTTVCALTAAWVWIGGHFPDTVDVISRSHYRAAVHNRRIRVFNRKSPREQVMRVGDAHVTTPARTACDLVLLPEYQEYQGNGDAMDQIVVDIMLEYRVSADDCLDILERNPFWPRATFGRELFTAWSRG